jgi:hypothetical protein
MADFLHYKDFEIHAAPWKLADSGRWQINIDIFKHRAGDTASRNFSASDTYETREEALKHCFQFGRQIIDGQSANCSVADL